MAGSDVITLDRHPIREHFITIVPNAGESYESVFRRVGEVVGQVAGQVVSVDVLGMSASAMEALPRFRAALGQVQPPVCWVRNTRSNHLCGVHLWLISGAPVEYLQCGDSVVGSVFEDGYGRYCRLAGVMPTEPSGPRVQQAEDVFQQMEDVLQRNKMTFSDVFRTWFYNDDILAWYGDFNGVRDRFFRDRAVFDNQLPASTGIGGGNIGQAALGGGLLAVRAKRSSVQVSEVPSPFQSSAADYGSSFSRAVEVTCPDHRRIYVSGTASIDEAGRTVFVGDAQAQVKLTMEVVEAILRSKGMDWADVVRSLAYFKRAEDAFLFEAYRDDNGLSPFPVIVAENDVCRDDLLFEIEVDAMSAD